MQLAQYLKDSLPNDQEYDVLHVQSTPRETHPLITQEKSGDLKTIKVEHFITISHNELIFFALEIFIYITINSETSTTESLLFVSKADTNGQNHTKVKIHQITSQIIKYLLALPIELFLNNIIPKELSPKVIKNSITNNTSPKNALKILINRVKNPSLEIPEQIKPYSIKLPNNYKKITKIALFTRPEPQYLFPNSGKSDKKHILSGDQLLNWWLKVLDSLLISSFDQTKTSANVRIPAEDNTNISRHLINLKFPNWKVGDIFSDKDEQKLAVYSIPLFPDDPKTRFLEHLVVEGRIKSISISQFWNELQIRQEFRLGVTVSVIGIEGQLKSDLVSNTSFESGLLLSFKEFKNVKTYITGEDYSTDEGSIESLINVKDYLEYKFQYKIPKIIGSYSIQAQISQEKRPLQVHSLNSTLIRKKIKK